MEQIIKAVQSSDNVQENTGFSEEFIKTEFSKISQVIESRLEDVNVYTYEDENGLIVLRESIMSQKAAVIDLNEEVVDIVDFSEISDDLEEVQETTPPRGVLHD